jgi:tetratricopeptide (TPR) repeat protein/tRNA A-37 threonylcarbamoyl transferase component Bud32
MAETRSRIDMNSAGLSHRYRLLHRLGVGGMGAVYAALDRLTGETVALKRVSFAVPIAGLDTASIQDLRRALTEEFRLLASLRHPNIISVMDYGFDAEQQTYYTMALLEAPMDILTAASDQPLNEKLHLLEQVLHALAYLHRRGILHRDVKPSNLLLTQERQVKVMDFGLAARSGNSTETTGTLAYMPPEVLLQAGATVQSDLYAVGLIAYEMFAGMYPFDLSDPTLLLNQLLYTNPDMSLVPEALQDIIARMLMKDPSDRYNSAESVLRDLAVVDKTITTETPALRESYLKAAHFIGREAELTTLRDALDKIHRNKHGSAWLIGGESGVGKSRLIDEVQIHALLRGALVVRGQGASGSSLPFEMWRDVVRRLVLECEVSDLEAGILHELIPDIERLLERPILGVPELSFLSAQMRLVEAIVALFQRQKQPVLLVLEDLQWATESLIPLRRLVTLANELPLFIIGSYRNDERPVLPSELPGMHLMLLNRLNRNEVAALSEAMIGESGNHPEVVDFLHQQTEGNVFFLVETVRTLAESYGQLSLVGSVTLPEHVMVSSIQTIVEHRIQRAPGWTHQGLQLAAVAGRRLDLRVMQVLLGGRLDAWLMETLDAMILEVTGNDWRFAHDRLREGVLMQVSSDDLPMLHQRVAEAIEHVYRNDHTRAAVLVEHWHMAGDTAKEAFYATLLTEQRRQVGILPEAEKMLERALALYPQDPDVRLRLYTNAGYLYYDQGKPNQSREAFSNALKLARALHRADIEGDALEGIGSAAYALSDFPEALRWYEEALAFRRKIDDLKGVGSTLHWMSVLSRLWGHYDLAKAYLDESMTLRRAIQDWHGLADSLYQMSLNARNAGQYTQAIAYLNEGRTLRERIGDGRGLGDDLNNLGISHMLLGDYEAARDWLSESLRMRSAGNNRRGMASCYNALGELAFIQDDFATAIRYFAKSWSVWTNAQDRWNIGNSHASLGYVQALAGEYYSARHHLLEAFRIGQATKTNFILLKSLIGWAQIALLETQPRQAAQWLGLVDAHPGTTTVLRYIYFPAIYNRLNNYDITENYELGKMLDLNLIAADILREHDTMPD